MEMLQQIEAIGDLKYIKLLELNYVAGWECQPSICRWGKNNPSSGDALTQWTKSTELKVDRVDRVNRDES